MIGISATRKTDRRADLGIAEPSFLAKVDLARARDTVLHTSYRVA